MHSLLRPVQGLAFCLLAVGAGSQFDSDLAH